MGAAQLLPKLTFYLHTGAIGSAPTLAPIAYRGLASLFLEETPLMPSPAPHIQRPALQGRPGALPIQSQSWSQPPMPRAAVCRWLEELHIWREINRSKERVDPMSAMQRGNTTHTQRHTQRAHMLTRHRAPAPALLATQTEWTRQQETLATFHQIPTEAALILTRIPQAHLQAVLQEGAAGALEDGVWPAEPCTKPRLQLQNVQGTNHPVSASGSHRGLKTHPPPGAHPSGRLPARAPPRPVAGAGGGRGRTHR